MTTDRLRVGVNLLWLRPGRAGGAESYAIRILAALADEADDDVDVTVLCTRSFTAAYPDLAARFPIEVSPVGGSFRMARVTAESTWLARRTARRDFDLVHHFNDVIPWIRTQPSVLTIHDLRSLAEGVILGRGHAAYLRRAVPRSARRSRVVMTPTDFVRHDVIQRLGVDPARVLVVSAPVLPSSRARGDVGGRRDGAYFLYPAITDRHKNHVVLLEAFAKVAASRPDVRLVLTGSPGNAQAEVGAWITRLALEDRVTRIGRVSERELDSLLQGATALVYPSRYEGFGLPLAEAMAAGCPVLASSATALPEVVGDAGLLVHPDDVNGWADGMARLLVDEGLRSRLVAAGRNRVASFTPASSVQGLIVAYRMATAG